jgi:hypothetical protein
MLTLICFVDLTSSFYFDIRILRYPMACHRASVDRDTGRLEIEELERGCADACLRALVSHSGQAPVQCSDARKRRRPETGAATQAPLRNGTGYRKCENSDASRLRLRLRPRCGCDAKQLHLCVGPSVAARDGPLCSRW